MTWSDERGYERKAANGKKHTQVDVDLWSKYPNFAMRLVSKYVCRVPNLRILFLRFVDIVQEAEAKFAQYH